MARRGMKSAAGAADEHQKEFGLTGFLRYFKLGDGESGDYLFIGSEETEPDVAHDHSFRDGKNFKTVIHRDNGCVACYMNDGGDRRVSRPSLRYRFTLYDLGWTKRTKNKEKSREAGEDKYDYEPVDEDVVTKKGIAKGKYVRRGRCGWKMPDQWFQAVKALDARIQKRCASCITGKIKVLGKKKKKDGTTIEKLSCSKCDDPVKQSLFNRIITITRSGTGTKTSYQFQVSTDEIPEDVLEKLKEDEYAQPYDWESVDPVPTSSRQAKDLGCKNPFKGDESETVSYDDFDDDDDDEDDEDFEDPFEDEDEDDEESSDDEDEDEDDFDDDDDEEDEEDSEGDDEDEDEEKEVRRPRKKKKTVLKKKSSKKKTVLRKKKSSKKRRS